MTAIKICGLTRISDISSVNQLRPEYVGFVFAKSRRQISESLAQQIKEHLDSYVKAVGVFVNEDIHRIVKLCQLKTIDMIQLHGDEDKEYIDRLKSMTPNKIIKAVQVRNQKDIEKVLSFQCDYLLLDSYSQGEYGGSGKVFDWSLTEGIERPFFLAGGLKIENVKEAIQRCNPYGVDISSGVESEGKKDHKKIKEFIINVRCH